MGTAGAGRDGQRPAEVGNQEKKLHKSMAEGERRCPAVLLTPCKEAMGRRCNTCELDQYLMACLADLLGCPSLEVLCSLLTQHCCVIGAQVGTQSFTHCVPSKKTPTQTSSELVEPPQAEGEHRNQLEMTPSWNHLLALPPVGVTLRELRSELKPPCSSWGP